MSAPGGAIVLHSPFHGVHAASARMIRKERGTPAGAHMRVERVVDGAVSRAESSGQSRLGSLASLSTVPVAPASPIPEAAACSAYASSGLASSSSASGSSSTSSAA